MGLENAVILLGRFHTWGRGMNQGEVGVGVDGFLELTGLLAVDLKLPVN